MWADSENSVDYLNYSEVSEMICEMISDDTMLPISIGVYGSWGMGKSTVLQLVEKELSADDKNLIIPFDAWLYQDFDEAKAALMAVIATSLYRATPETFKEKAKSFLERTNKLKLLGLAADMGAFAFGIPTMGGFSRAAGAATNIAEGKSTEADVQAVKDGISQGRELLSGLVREKQERSPPEEIAAFRCEFSDLLDTIDRKIVVFVDNLDRCLPSKAISTLEAMRLFLFLPRTAFVVAADEEMIRHAVAKYFSDPGERHVSEYLDKLIQVPVRLPQVGLHEVRAYLFMLTATRAEIDPSKVEALRVHLIESLRRSWSDEPPFDVDQVVEKLGLSRDSEIRRSLDTMDRLASILAFSQRVSGNPRIIKRMLNVIRMRSSVARRRKMEIDEAIIAKLLLFERCTSEEAIRGLSTRVGAAPNGKVSILSELEAADRSELKKLLPDEWVNFSEFLAEWLSMDPSLGDTDLRPAVYLARETLPVQFVRSRLSSTAKEAVDILLKTSTVHSAISASAAERIGADEAGLAMEEIISAFSRNPDWSRARSDFRGAVVLARRWNDAHAKLVRYVEGMSEAPRWAKRLMRIGSSEGER
ncbi:KAP family P-loop NTPase fold protein [Nitratireductor sp. CH_MIT9313-5]|uniref:KAP family P-loop NTPase fold protein n=1 Tax=Nitratireductor sp. CH_MIT9313-5 TaxID=3107764 RepID=UPI00300A00EA